jgi:sensor domain CHASE-containing protein
MKIRLKIAIIMILLGVIVALFTLFLADNILLQGFVTIENSHMTYTMERVNDFLLEKIFSIDLITHDYAIWDATYDALSGENTMYGSVDLVGSLENTNLDFVVLMRNDGKIMFAKDIFSGVEMDYNLTSVDLDRKIFYYYFEKNYASIICANESDKFNGFIQLPTGLAMISSRPVLMSSGNGPVKGTIIFGRMIDKGFIEKLSKQTHMIISFYPYDSISYENKSKLKALFNIYRIDNVENITAPIINELSNSSTLMQIIHINQNTISGNILLNDIYGRPVALLEVIDQRDVFLEGKRAISYLVHAILIVVLTFIIVAYLLFNKFIVSRLISMERQMKDIQNKKLTSSRITITSRDELSSFGEAVNTALDAIEKATVEKQAVFDADPDSYFYVDSSWKIIDYKLTDILGDIVSKKNMDKLKTLSLSDLLNSGIMNKLFKARLESEKNLKPVILEFDLSVNGSSKVFEARVVAINNTKMSLVLLGDITDRKRFEQRLLSKNKDLEKFNKFAIDRELRMSDLKKEMRDLKKKTEK